jgi:transposase
LAVCRVATQRHDPYAYLKDVLTRLPTQKASALVELLPHNWVSAGKV